MATRDADDAERALEQARVIGKAVATAAVVGAETDAAASFVEVAAALADPTLKPAQQRDAVAEYAKRTRALGARGLAALALSQHVMVATGRGGHHDPNSGGGVDSPPATLGDAAAHVRRSTGHVPPPRATSVALRKAFGSRRADGGTGGGVAAVVESIDGAAARVRKAAAVGGMFAGMTNLLSAEATVAPVPNGRHGPELPPGSAAMSQAVAAAERRVAEVLGWRARRRAACRWLAQVGPTLLAPLGFALVVHTTTTADGTTAPTTTAAPTDDEGRAWIVYPGLCVAALACGEGQPQLVHFASLLQHRRRRGSNSSSGEEEEAEAVLPDSPAAVLQEVTGVFHSRGSLAGLLALKAVAVGLALTAIADQAAAMVAAAASIEIAGGVVLTCRRWAGELTTQPPSVRLFVEDAATGSETVVTFAVAPATMDLTLTVEGSAAAVRPSSPLSAAAMTSGATGGGGAVVSILPIPNGDVQRALAGPRPGRGVVAPARAVPMRRVADGSLRGVLDVARDIPAVLLRQQQQ